jgi:hypothetical protein
MKAVFVFPDFAAIFLIFFSFSAGILRLMGTMNPPLYRR